MKPMSRNGSAGFTLLEVMVAMMITLVGLLGLLESLSIVTEHTRKNQLRDEAVLIGEEQLNVLRARPFANAFDNCSTLQISSKQSKWTYFVERKRTPIPNTSSKQLDVRVSWSYKNVSSHHELLTITSQP